MGKRGGGKRRVSDGTVPLASSYGLHTSLSLREQARGKKQSHSAKSILKRKHLQQLAEWSAGLASIPNLGAFFGRRFAVFGEALGISPDRSLFPCQRCETLLQPNFNCNVRIEKNRSKRRRRCRNTSPPMQNNVVYTCDFCSHRNLKPGTPKGYARQTAPSKANSSSKPQAGVSTAHEFHDKERTNANKLEKLSTLISDLSASLTETQTPASTGAKLLDSKRRKRKKQGPKGSISESLVSSVPAEAEKASGASRKRKKSWTSLKEIAANEEHERNERFKNISIPFVL